MHKFLLYGLVAFYLFAGGYHFVNPTFYEGLIPPYFPYPKAINLISGLAEILLALGMLSVTYRKLTSRLIILMLLAFVPSHIYFIQIGSCEEGGLCVPAWISWGRLLVIHPILILWAYWVGHKKPLST